MSNVEGIQRTEADYASLAAKLAQFTQQLTPAEASALAIVIDHAKEHAAEVTGYEFTEPEEDEVGGFSFSFGAQQFGGLGSLSQFGLMGGDYNRPSFGGGTEYY